MRMFTLRSSPILNRRRKLTRLIPGLKIHHVKAQAAGLGTPAFKSKRSKREINFAFDALVPFACSVASNNQNHLNTGNLGPK